jgi:hypothetical protein
VIATKLPAPRGYKTVGINLTGTGTVKVICTIGSGAEEATGYVGTTLSTTGVTSFTDACETINVEIATCSGCTLNKAWLRYWAPSN